MTDVYDEANHGIIRGRLALYPILPKYSIMTGIAGSLRRSPVAKAAALDWSELRCSTASR